MIVDIHTKTGLVLKVKIVSRFCQKARTEVQALVSFSGDLHMSIGLMICQKGYHDDVISDNRSTIFTFYIHQVFERLQFPQALDFRLS